MLARAAAGAGVGPGAVEAVDAALGQVVAALAGAPADLAVCFVGAAYAQDVRQVEARVSERLSPGTLIAATVQGVVADGVEIEQPASLSLWAASLPGVEVAALRYAPPVEGSVSWELPPTDAAGVVLLADPFTFPVDAYLAWLAQARPGMPVSGGLASGASRPGGNRLLIGSQWYDDGAIGVALGGSVRLRHLVSQGCRPVGKSFVVTGAQHNRLVELGGKPAVQRVQQAFEQADAADRDLMRTSLHVGVVIDEYAEVQERGDFLIRTVMGADPDSGAVAIGDQVRIGQTVRFQVRDAVSADEDLRELLAALRFSESPVGALLFTCNGRGRGLFGVPDHDANMLREAFGQAPVAGFFAAGEIGPIGDRSFVHGFTASVLIVESS